MTPLISIIIVNHNTPELVSDCVDSIRRYVGVDMEIIIVESGLDRPVPEAAIVRWGAIQLAAKGRCGFGRANNLGAKQAKGRFLWLLNSDTVIPDARINDLFPFMDRSPDIGLASPVLFNDTGLSRRQPDFYANFQSFRTVLTRSHRPRIDWNDQRLPEILAVDQVTAAAMVIRTDLFRELGGFDERYFMYMEDEDLCYRARLVGAKAGIATGCAVVHLQGKSISNSRERKRYYYASQTLFWKTHRGLWAAWLMRTLRLPKRVLNG